MKPRKFRFIRDLVETILKALIHFSEIFKKLKDRIAATTGQPL